jgi:predicted ATPase
LGIELAATWIRVLSCGEIAHEIEHDLDFLTASAAGAPERHQSLRAAFDHSWNLLSAEEQRVMRQLSVFRGGFRRAAADQVAGASLPLLSALVDKSLLRRTGAGWYGMHQLIEQYVTAHLEADPEECVATHDRHCTYYIAMLQQHEETLRAGIRAETVAELILEIDNLRSAWEWAVAHPAANKEVRDRAQQLHTRLSVQLSPEQLEAVRLRAHAKPFDAFVAQVLGERG